MKRDDTLPLVVCIEEADGVVEHAVEIWIGKIYNPNQVYVLEGSQLAFDAVCVRHKFSWLKELYQLKIMPEVQLKRKKGNQRRNSRQKKMQPSKR